jgi:hypothetical protein
LYILLELKFILTRYVEKANPEKSVFKFNAICTSFSIRSM